MDKTPTVTPHGRSLSQTTEMFASPPAQTAVQKDLRLRHRATTRNISAGGTPACSFLKITPADRSIEARSTRQDGEKSIP
jgi:hypothetical protein